MLPAEELTYHLSACALNSRKSQKIIYSCFYCYALAICGQYTSNREDADEIVNDGFLKIFKGIHHYKPAYTNVMSSFKGWIRKIMIYTAIDHFRKNRRHKAVTCLDITAYKVASAQEDAAEKLVQKEIIQAAQKLSPAYQSVMNLFVLEGLSHDEIAVKLKISTGASKSNLSKARKQLQKILLQQNDYYAEMAS